MPLRAAVRRRRAVSVTSLIDVIFLLLLFFMLASTFTKFSEVKLTSGGATPGAAADVEAPLFLRLAADRITLNGADVAAGQLPEQVASARKGDETQLLISIADAQVTSQRLADILVPLSGIGGLSVTVLD